MPYVYENCKALYNVRHCHCHFSCKFCYEIDSSLCKIIMRERDRGSMNSLDMLSKFLMRTMIKYGKRVSFKE